MELNFIFFGLMIIIHFSNNFANAQDIFVFSQTGHKGTKVKLSIAQCTNLPEPIAGKAASVDTRGRCASFYDQQNCTGGFIEIMPRSPAHGNLEHWGLKPLSTGPCLDPCHENVTGKVPEKEEKLDMAIFSRKDFKGAYHEMKVQGCTLIPTKFVKNLKSVRSFGQCLQFFNNVNCNHKGYWPEVDSIELRKGTPFHSDIGAWWFPEVKAVSHCSFKCNNDSIAEMKDNIKKEQETFPSSQNQVFLYDETNFTGNRLDLIVTQCMNITEEWEGAAMSIKTYHNQSCVALHDKRNCEEGSLLNVIGSAPDLSLQKFDAMARSISLCSKNTPLALSGKDSISRTTIRRKSQGSVSVTAILVTLMVVSLIMGAVILYFKKRGRNNSPLIDRNAF